MSGNCSRCNGKDSTCSRCNNPAYQKMMIGQLVGRKPCSRRKDDPAKSCKGGGMCDSCTSIKNTTPVGELPQQNKAFRDCNKCKRCYECILNLHKSTIVNPRRPPV